MKSTLKNTLLIIGMALVTASPGFAQSTSFTITTDFSNDGIVTITDDGGANWESVYAGEYSATVGNASENIFCVDPAHEITGGQTYQADISEDITNPAGTLQTSGPTAGYYNGGLASAMNANDLAPDNLNVVTGQERSDEVAFLADNYLNATTFTSAAGTTNVNDNETGVQLAIWDIITDGGYNNGVDLNGDFAVAGGTSSTYVDAMDYYMQQADQYDTTPSAYADWIQAPVTVAQGGADDHFQDFVDVPGGVIPNGSPAPVPEPGIGAFLCSMIIAGGIMLLFKRRTVSAN